MPGKPGVTCARRGDTCHICVRAEIATYWHIGTCEEEIASSPDTDQQFKQRVLVILEMKQSISSCLLSLGCS